MTNPPTGRLVPTAGGNELILSRTFRAPIEDVWASVTESDRTARWFGAWKGDAAPGRMIKVQMGFEDQTPWLEKRIDACDPPRRLALSNESGNMRIELLLSHTDGLTELQLVHHLDPTDDVGAYGPGWEYYLDMLLAARDGLPTPTVDDYYPAMKPYYEALSQTDPACLARLQPHSPATVDVHLNVDVKAPPRTPNRTPTRCGPYSPRET